MLSVILSAAVISWYTLSYSHVYRCDLPSHTALYMGVGYERFVFVPASFGKPDHNPPSPPPTSFYYFAGSSVQYNIYMGLINKVDMVCLPPVGYGV